MVNFKFLDGTLYISGDGEKICYDDILEAFLRLCKSYDDIKRVEILDGITEIGIQCFQSLALRSMESVSISSSVKVIQGRAFENCESLKEVTMADGVIGMADDVFQYCKNLKKVRLSKSLQVIPADCFKDCLSLEDLVIPEGVKVIEPYAFSGCKGLKNVVFPSSLQEIKSFAFDNCENITSYTVGEKVSDILSLLFDGNPVLKSIYFSENNSYFASSSDGGVIYNKEKTELLYILPSVLDAYIEDTVQNVEKLVIFPESKLKSISLPNVCKNQKINVPLSVDVRLRNI